MSDPKKYDVFIVNDTHNLGVKNIKDGFEIEYGGTWFLLRDGVISPLMFTPSEQEGKPHPLTND